MLKRRIKDVVLFLPKVVMGLRSLTEVLKRHNIIAQCLLTSLLAPNRFSESMAIAFHLSTQASIIHSQRNMRNQDAAKRSHVTTLMTTSNRTRTYQDQTNTKYNLNPLRK